MRARIYQPARTATQSGPARSQGWVLEFQHIDGRAIDPLMGWTSSGDTQSQVTLHFDTAEAAQAYAQANGIEAQVQVPQVRKANIRPGGYGENFATNRKGAWTH